MPLLRDSILALQKGKANKQFALLYGNKAGTIDSQIKRYQALIREFSKKFGQDRSIELFSAPGRTEVGGNHTDHNGGRVLAAAVNLDAIAVASKNDENVIRVVDTAGYPAFAVDLDQLQPIDKEKYTSTALVRGICARLKALGYSIGGFDACVAGRVPKGSGLSSSAAFEILFVAILNHLYNKGKINGVLSAQIAQYAENVFFGKPCGLMDQTTAAVGGFVTIDFKDFNKPIVKKVKFDFSRSGYTLVIVDTGGNHADLNDDYAALPGEMKAVAKALGGTVLRDLSFKKVFDNLKLLGAKVNDRAILRAFHFFADDARVVSQVKALENNDFGKFLELVVESGRSSWMLCQNCYTHKNIEEQGITKALAVSEQLLNGKGAWRVHGGGFAGTIQAFVPNKLLLEYVNALQNVFGKNSCHALMIRPVGSVKIDIS